ncbi:MAG: helix-turn-helix transcriptional regulator [Bacteroidetes bacterium]|nr:helix-turn-helix transcriptional regulator [Bacteroidota bacterium]
MSPGHLNENSRKVLGKTASELIHERLILEIKRMLFHSNQTINEIAFSLNFDDPAYFGRSFRKYAGMTPISFRKTIREKYQ